MKTLTKERPVIFSGPMVRAILDGRKTQTRRVITAKQIRRAGGCWHNAWKLLCCGNERERYSPFGIPGDRLWARETWRAEERASDMVDGVRFAADDSFQPIENAQDAADRWVVAYDNGRHGARWRPSIFMPRWASRLTLEVVAVRVQRLQEITEEDARAEGCHGWYQPMHPDVGETDGRLPHEEFRDLWNSINAARGFGWDSNPWVWVVEFKRTQ